MLCPSPVSEDDRSPRVPPPSDSDVLAEETGYGVGPAPRSAEDLSQRQAARVRVVYAATGTPITFRSRKQTRRLFGAFPPRRPGVVRASQWRPDILEHRFATPHLLAGIGHLNGPGRP